MSRPLSSVVEWFTKLEPCLFENMASAADDPRLGEVIESWNGDQAALRPGRPALLGFPQDEGVRRNRGRPGAARAPQQVRHWLRRLTRWDAQTGHDLGANPPLDLGDVKLSGSLEQTQQVLGEIVHELLGHGMIPLILGGGHETAFGHFLGYAAGKRHVGIINLDAHLDVRPFVPGAGHSGSPFRQAIEYAQAPLLGADYVCLGAQPAAVSRDHARYVHSRGGVIRWADEVRCDLATVFAQEVERLASSDCHVYVSLDADVVRAAEVPGVSAPNPAGVAGAAISACARLAGASRHVLSFDIVEINPLLDRDDQSCHWAALVAWTFLSGIAQRDDCSRLVRAGGAR